VVLETVVVEVAFVGGELCGWRERVFRVELGHVREPRRR